MQLFASENFVRQRRGGGSGLHHESCFGAHFFDARPPQMDPIATSSPSMVRFEGFSGCCGVYARVDLDERVSYSRITAYASCETNPEKWISKSAGPMPINLCDYGLTEIAAVAFGSAVIKANVVPANMLWQHA